MIKDVRIGDILDRSNRSDIIIGMNTEFDDVSGIGRPFVGQIRNTRAITLGTVVTFDYDGERELHMLICHKLGAGGWDKADQFVRYGMDYLWKSRPERNYSIVYIGTGRVGKRDGADRVAIHSAIATSFLPVELFVLDQKEQVTVAASATVHPLRPLKMWNMDEGEIPITPNAIAA